MNISSVVFIYSVDKKAKGQKEVVYKCVYVTYRSEAAQCRKGHGRVLKVTVFTL